MVLRRAFILLKQFSFKKMGLGPTRKDQVIQAYLLNLRRNKDTAADWEWVFRPHSGTVTPVTFSSCGHRKSIRKPRHRRSKRAKPRRRKL